MQHQCGELSPIGDALADLDSPVKAIREASPQARHHFTQADQVNQLVAASEADAERGFMARLLALCSLSAPTPATTVPSLISWTDKTHAMNPSAVSSESLARANKDNVDTVQMCPYSLT